VVDTVARHVNDFLGDACAISILSEDGRLIEPVSIRHPDPDVTQWMRETSGHPIPAGEGIAGRVIATGESVLIASLDPAAAPDVVGPAGHGFLDRYGMASIAMVPLGADDEVFGCIGAVRTRAGRPYTADDVALLERFARQAAVAIRQARVQRSDLGVEGLETLFRTSFDGVLIATQDGRMLAANAAACAILGRSEDDIVRVGRAGVVDDTNDEEVRDAIGRRDRTGHVDAIVTMRRGDGTGVRARIRSTLFHTAAGEPRTCLVFRPLD
jgi:PAS domain S-box-containing protein